MANTLRPCRSIACTNTTLDTDDYCYDCCMRQETKHKEAFSPPVSNLTKYPQYFKDVRHLSEVDVYAIHDLFEIDDSSGCIQHASKKLLLSGVRTGGKSKLQDIKEARDTLTRWLELQSK